MCVALGRIDAVQKRNRVAQPGRENLCDVLIDHDHALATVNERQGERHIALTIQVDDARAVIMSGREPDPQFLPWSPSRMNIRSG